MVLSKRKNLKVGQWYYSSENCIAFVFHGNKKVYGFLNGLWFDDMDLESVVDVPDGFEKMRWSEGEAMMTDEANHRGLLADGVKIKHRFNSTDYTVKSPQLSCYNKEDGSWAIQDGHGLVYRNGEWAEVIKPETTVYEKMDKLLKDLAHHSCSNVMIDTISDSDGFKKIYIAGIYKNDCDFDLYYEINDERGFGAITIEVGGRDVAVACKKHFPDVDVSWTETVTKTCTL